jgi:serine/threonine protein phosphatase PrpC
MLAIRRELDSDTEFNPEILKPETLQASTVVNSESETTQAPVVASGSGSTVTLLYVGEETVSMESLGDSPIIAVFKGSDGQAASCVLNPQQSIESLNFSGAKKDSNGTLRANGVSVACAGHGGLFANVQAFSAEHNTKEDLLRTAKALGIKDPTEVVLLVASDGIFDSSPGKYGGNKAVSVSHTRKTNPRGKVVFEEKNAESTLEEAVFGGDMSPKEVATRLLELVSGANPNDDATIAVAFSGSVQDLKNTQPTLAIVADGNGRNGHIAAQAAVEIAQQTITGQTPINPNSNPHPLSSKNNSSLENRRNIR